MGAAPVLIMLAVLGVDYGWQPDGTTSSRGDNIEYIVQISPDQAKQLGSIGEITSTIDPSIQGRVSRIVVRIGDGPLPKLAGRVTPAPSSLQARTSAPIGNGDEQIVPIPEIVDSVSSTSPTRSTGMSSESVMKPDPQGSSFQMPESLQAGATSALEQVRTRAAQAATQTATQLEAQARSTLDSQVEALSNMGADAVNRAASSAQNGFNSLTNPAVSTDPTVNRDNRWSDLSTRSSTGTAAAGPSTDPVDPSARSAGWPGFVGPTQPSDARSSDPRSLSNPYAGTAPPTASFGASPSSTYSAPANTPANPLGATASPVASSAAPPLNNSLTRDPSDPKWSGYGTSPNFGALPGSASPRTSFETANQTTSPSATGQTGFGLPSTTAASAPNTSGYTQDAQGNIFDSLGRQVDRNGNPINPSTAKWVNSSGQPTDQYGNLLDASGQPIDQYGRRVDAYNRPISDARVAQKNDLRSTPVSTQPAAMEPPAAYPPNLNANTALNSATGLGATAADRFGNASPYNASTYSPNATAYPQTTLTPPPLDQSGLSAQQIANMQSELRSYQQREAANAKLVNYNEEGGSPSDQRYVNQSRSATAAQTSAPVSIPTVKPRNVAVQFFFNFVLLISLVGNAYLIFETNNLRRKFRNMINSVRTSKVSAQPVT